MTRRPATISFAPRSVLNCLDLAVMYLGRQSSIMLTLWLCTALPSCALVYVLSYYWEFDLRMALAVIYCATAILGGWMIAAVTPGAFDHMIADGGGREEGKETQQPFPPELLNMVALLLSGLFLALMMAADSLPPLLAQTFSFVVALLLSVVLFARAALLLQEQSGGRVGISRPLLVIFALRALLGIGPALCLFSGNGWLIFLGIVLIIVPGIPLAVRYGFVAERACLRQLNRRLHHPGTDDLLKSETTDLFLRGCGIVIFSGLLWAVLFFTLDVMSSLLFQVSILTGRLGEFDMLSEQFWAFLVTDPLILTALTATALLAFPIGRLAWFLCYIDVRVRHDCWDVELNLSQEAARLRETA